MKRENNPIRLPLDTWCSHNARRPTKETGTCLYRSSAECRNGSVEGTECRKCKLWKMGSFENGECKRYVVWSVENVRCGECGVLKMGSANNMKI